MSTSGTRIEHVIISLARESRLRLKEAGWRVLREEEQDEGACGVTEELSQDLERLLDVE
ncbi:hypothetical protein QFC24_003933 [Naganishia onofrii]|uniref:Uncharacterized protein n=1 Tax=Naganishia onofrii TaxID=1851511 RepID=A0ACC2XHM3_9TREE|nr:hypothetical protein QFC24_003933 [Naganishia onofrii]